MLEELKFMFQIYKYWSEFVSEPDFNLSKNFSLSQSNCLK